VEYQKHKKEQKAAEDREFGGAGQQASGGAGAGKKGGSEAQGAVAQGGNVPDLHQMIGYMPKRGDFD
jgi:transcriptional adapter 2-alpha